jgi:hypothetical protein
LLVGVSALGNRRKRPDQITKGNRRKDQNRPFLEDAWQRSGSHREFDHRELGGEDFTKILKKEIVGIRSESLIKGRIWTINRPGGISGFRGFERERKRHCIVIPKSRNPKYSEE